MSTTYIFARGIVLAGLAAIVLGMLPAPRAAAEDVKIGVLFDLSGPMGNFEPPMFDAVKLAADEINANGGVLRGRKIQLILEDSKGTVQGSIAAAEKLVVEDNVVAVVGALSSVATIAAAHNVTVPNRVVLISPGSTAPIITTLEDNDFVFRTIPSDAYQGWMLGKLVYGQGYRRVALTYVNNDYGSGIADTFRGAFENLGGTITVAQAHEPNKDSYLPELTALSVGNPEALVLIAFAPSGGITIIKEALAHNLFKQFIGTDSLRDELLIKEVGADKLKGIFFTAPVPVPATSGLAKFEKLFGDAYKTTKNKLFISNAYDALELVALAIEQAGSTDRSKIRDALRNVCCAPGEVVEPGEWAKAKALIAAGKKINYEGASGSLEFDESGDVTGATAHFVIEDGAFKEVGLVMP
jgi:branched-chain amino acid transport system substrate-binding protein